jgi:hypothetical protein
MVLMDGRTCECGVTFRVRYATPSGDGRYVSVPSVICCPACAKRHEFSVEVTAMTERFSSRVDLKHLPSRRDSNQYF